MIRNTSYKEFFRFQRQFISKVQESEMFVIQEIVRYNSHIMVIKKVKISGIHGILNRNTLS